MNLDLRGEDLVAAITAQRNAALDALAQKEATIQALLRGIAELEKKVTPEAPPP